MAGVVVMSVVDSGVRHNKPKARDMMHGLPPREGPGRLEVMRTLRSSLIFAAVFSAVLTPLTGVLFVIALTGLLPTNLRNVVEPICDPGFCIALYIGDALKLPAAGMHSPNLIALLIGITIQWFVIGLALSLVDAAVRRERGRA